jgi:hypothetical protein
VEKSAKIDGDSRCGWDPSAQSDGSKSEQARHCMDLQHCLHWLRLALPHLVLAVDVLPLLKDIFYLSVYLFIEPTHLVLAVNVREYHARI